MINSEKYCPILCNQENFLLQSNNFKVKQCLQNAHIIFKKAIKDSINGRPKNGMFIAVPDELKEYVVDVSPNHWRVQAIILITPKNKMLIINSYFPTDPQVLNFDPSELLTTLSAINDVLNDNAFDSVIWTGDINGDFIRQTQFTSIIESFINEKSLVKSWDKFAIDFTHLFDIEDHSYTPILDHFFWSENISNNILLADVLHLPNNLSDHCPIYCSINVNNLHSKCRIPITPKSKPSWKKATSDQKENYHHTLDHCLRQLVVPRCIEHCHDVHCHDENLLMEMLRTIQSTADTCLPSSETKDNRNKQQIACWREEVQPFKDTAMSWHSIWLSAGRPINTELHIIMERTRNIYHFQIRKNKKMADTLKKNALLDACINNNGDIFQEIKKQRRVAPTVSNIIDGVTGNVESHFASIFKQLYNSVDDQSELFDVTKHFNDYINPSNINDVLKISPTVVREAITRLNNNK